MYIGQEVNIWFVLSCFVCQPQYICWCSLVKQLSIWPRSPWVLCLTSAYVSVNWYSTLCPIMKKAIRTYTMICLNLQFSRRIIYTLISPFTAHIKFSQSQRESESRIMPSNLGGFFSYVFILRNSKHLFFLLIII